MPTAECQTSVPTAFAEEPLQKSERTATFLAFGESMIRYMPLDEPDQHSQTSRHLPQPFLRSLGGDELNVTVALSLIGFPSKWISVVPTGPMGDILLDGCMHHGVEPAVVRVDGDVGTYTMIPERKTVVYQRRHSVFALQDPEALDWPSLLGGGAAAADRPWLHLTGITPLVSPNAAKSWERAVVTAAGSIIPISLDLNHRPQLGTFDQLWAIVKPHAPTFEVMILSLGQLNDIGQLTHPEWQPLTPAEAPKKKPAEPPLPPVPAALARKPPPEFSCAPTAQQAALMTTRPRTRTAQPRSARLALTAVTPHLARLPVPSAPQALPMPTSAAPTHQRRATSAPKASTRRRAPLRAPRALGGSTTTMRRLGARPCP